MINKMFTDPAMAAQDHRMKSEENINDKAMPVIDKI